MDRRDFFKTTIAGAAALALSQFESAFAEGSKDSLVGKKWPGWVQGHFQVHFIYTGVCESMFLIFPDGTTMLLDCGDFDALARGKLAVPVLPHPGRHAGEWIARYIQRVNPGGKDIDYMMLSHYHNDHAGTRKFYASKEIRDGFEHCLSGFNQAGEYFKFHKGIDRAWPTFDDPLPLPESMERDALGNIREFYRYQQAHNGMEVERFRLGATDQIVPVHNPSRCRNFSVRNICANGRICSEDGTVTDLYADRIRKNNLTKLNENGMSLGMIFSYGPFRFYTAGDFSDKWKNDDGTVFWTEDAMADVCGRANVAKVNHHGHNSMPEKLVGALRSQVYVSCVWDQLHNLPKVMARLADRSIYPDDRIICPGIFPAERRAQDEGQPWLDDVAAASFDGGHIILDVEPGGKKFSINYITAADESMTVRSVMRFRTR